jgi:NADPH-dependent curcumin reductase
MPRSNKKILLARRPVGMVSADDFQLVEAELPALQEGEVLVRTQYISLDPAMRGWMNEGTTYIQGVGIGAMMRAFAAGTVVKSRHPGFAVGDAVQGLTGAQQYAISNGNFQG